MPQKQRGETHFQFAASPIPFAANREQAPQKGEPAAFCSHI